MKMRVDCFLPGMGAEQAKSVTDGLRREEAVDKIFWVDGSENDPADECETGSAGRCALRRRSGRSPKPPLGIIR